MESMMFSRISSARQRLTKVIQSLGFGVIELDIAFSEPCFEPIPKILQDVKIGSSSDARTEGSNDDFALSSRMIELFRHLDQLGSAKVKIEVKHSQPFRLTIERTAEKITDRSATKGPR